jgi:hypothetical protein
MFSRSISLAFDWGVSDFFNKEFSVYEWTENPDSFVLKIPLKDSQVTVKIHPGMIEITRRRKNSQGETYSRNIISLPPGVSYLDSKVKTFKDEIQITLPKSKKTERIRPEEEDFTPLPRMKNQIIY